MTAGRRLAPNGYEIKVNNEAPEESKGSQMELASMGTLNDHSEQDNRHGFNNVSMLQPNRVGSSDHNGSFVQPPY